MTSYEDMESIIEEWFADGAVNGLTGIAETYATILASAKKQLSYYDNEFSKIVKRGK